MHNLAIGIYQRFIFRVLLQVPDLRRLQSNVDQSRLTRLARQLAMPIGERADDTASDDNPPL